MKRSIIIVLVLLIVIAIAGYAIYSIFIKPSEHGVKTEEKLKPVSITVMTDWSQWGRDDFKRYFFAESGMPRAGVVLPSASMKLNITNISFVYSIDINEWVKAGLNGTVDGFIGQNRYNITYLCNVGALKPIEDPEILKLAEQIQEVFKGYTKDGKLCWIAIYWAPYPWLVSAKYAEKYNIQIPETWADLMKPEYLALILKGAKLVAVYPISNRAQMVTTVNVILSKYGWEMGWTIIATVMGGASKLDTSSSAARSTVFLGNALLTVLTFEDAYVGYSMDSQNLRIVFPKNETGLWLTPIAIAANADSDGVDGMYRLIRWWLTDAQDMMLLNRSGWLNMPVLGFNNTSPRMMYKRIAEQNAYLPSLDMELALGEAGPVIQLYADLLVADKEVRELIGGYVQKVVKLYLDGKIDLDEYYSYLRKLGEPLEFIDPSTKTTATFTLDKARELGLKLRRGEITSDSLGAELKQALLEKLRNLSEDIG
ncbi:ABC-type Fe3+ transport system periplasmic component [Ignisphaera aggregans DSM 17230]|uniref:ABC-type Fe3+ transport system periplasmic component n=1 Tax=Ignisphaera aggregans (strain DSM 17230 / JCM 13409 / AQ1.S1) TaxID=583356 RepID=E0SSL8_IGNAA|nr:ABC-type Fe3+ transport system periplasmic component [Ignisphaera aggregans DSM 17230]